MPTLKPVPDAMTLGTTRNEAHLQLMNKVRLNRYDMKFMANISEKYLLRHEPLSPGQNTLYEKIVHKYRKQLKKLKVNYKDLLALPWADGIVATEVLTQKTYFRIADSDDGPEMQLYFNFNKKRIEEVRALAHDDNGNHLNRGSTSNFGNGQKYNFNWNNAKKTWYGPFNVYLYKQLYDFAKEARLCIDKSVLALNTTMDAHGTKEDWTPGLRLINGTLYINCIAETMLPFLKDIDLTDTSIANIERLSKLGLTAPDDYDAISEYVNSVSHNTKHVLTTAEDVLVLKDYINVSGRKVLFHIPELDAPNSKLPLPLRELRECASWGKDSGFYTDPLRGIPSYRIDGRQIADAIDDIVKEGYTTLVTTKPIAGQLNSQAAIGRFALKADKVIYISLKETNDNSNDFN